MTLHAFSSYSRQAGSTRVRLYDWFDYLNIDVVPHTYVGQASARPSVLGRMPLKVLKAELGLRAVDLHGHDALVSREASPLSNGALEERILRSARNGVFDFDDALFHETGIPRRWIGGAAKTIRAVRSADRVIAGNDYLANWAIGYNPAVTVIPSCINPADYIPKRSWKLHDPPVLAWLGSPGTEKYVAPIVPALRLAHERTGARLRLISGTEENPALADLDGMIERVPWSIGSFARHLSGADVGLGPLDDTPFARGKCAYKLLQYAATGLPMVATPIGANELALERFGGISVTAEIDWADALLEILAESESERARRGTQAMDAVARSYSYEAWSETWRSVVGA